MNALSVACVEYTEVPFSRSLQIKTEVRGKAAVTMVKMCFKKDVIKNKCAERMGNCYSHLKSAG